MTIALKIGDENSVVKGFIYMDAVTVYNKSFKGKVTSFPIDAGAKITDHYIGDNNKFTLEGVVSNVDIGGLSDLVNINDEKPLNAKSRPSSPRIQEQSSSLQFLPSAVKQFFERGEASVEVDEETENSLPSVEELFSELMSGLYYNSVDNKWRNKMTLTTLYEMDGTNFVNAKTDLVITDIDIKEDADSGDALFVSISIEKVRFVTLDKTDMPKNAKAGSKKKTAGTENKGKQTTTEKDSTDTTETRKPQKYIPGQYSSNRTKAEANQSNPDRGKK